MSDYAELLSKLLSGKTIADWAYCELDQAETFTQFRAWIEGNYHGPLNYLADERLQKRASLKNIFPSFKSAIIFLFSYANQTAALEEFYRSEKSNGLKVASFVVGFDGEDYHHVLKRQLEDIATKFKLVDSELETTLTLDVSPVLERDLAVRSGLGWFGKNSMLISKKLGSFVIIGSLLFNKKLSLPLKPRAVDHCGTCTRCISACPTQAIGDKRMIDARKCISTFTIEEFKEVEPPVGFSQSRGEIFGCDICQIVCPWNSRHIKLAPTQIGLDERFAELLTLPLDKLIERYSQMSNREFRRYFKGTSLERTGRLGLLKNLLALKKNYRAK